MFQPILKLNTAELKILTPSGFEPFAGVSFNGEKQTIKIRFCDEGTLEVTGSHLLFHRGVEIPANKVKPGIILDGIGNERSRTVTNIRLSTTPSRVFDVVQTTSHRYLVNGKVAHNCIFVSSDPLLIDSLKAQLLTDTPPLTVNHGIKIWKQFDDTDPVTSSAIVAPDLSSQLGFDNWYRSGATAPQQTQQRNYSKQCIMTIDPGKGVGNDYTAVEVFSYPDLEQMMEYRSNESRTGEVYKIMKYLWKKAQVAGWEVLFTVENNGVGEGIVTLFENDETLPDNVEIISDESKQLGMNTNVSTKFQACKIFKEFVESGKIKFHSSDLIREVKTYVQKGGSYAAQPGSTDDCVSATLLTCRVIKQISTYDPDAYQKLYEINELEDDQVTIDAGDDEDDYDEMPIVF